MSCPDPICRIISCPPTDDLPSYYGQYNLQSGVTYENNTIIVPSPGGGSYTVPPGTIVINVPPGATAVTYQGCQSTVSLPIPAGSTPAAIQLIVNQVMQQIAAQLAICNAPEDPHNPIPSPFPPTTFVNDEVFRSCPGGLLMNLIGTLPKNVFFDIDGLTLQAGVITSGVSVADADKIGDNFLIGLISGGALVQCGYWNTEQSFTCPDTSVQTVPADTYFSVTSQSAADALALAAAESACSSPATIDWTQMFYSGWVVSFTSVEPIVSPISGDTGDVFTTECAGGGNLFFSSDLAEIVFNDEADNIGAYLAYNGTAASAKLRITNGLTNPSFAFGVVQTIRVSAWNFDTFVQDILVENLTGNYGSHEFTLSIPDMTGYGGNGYIVFECFVHLEVTNNNTVRPQTVLTMSGTFSNT